MRRQAHQCHLTIFRYISPKMAFFWMLLPVVAVVAGADAVAGVVLLLFVCLNFDIQQVLAAIPEVVVAAAAVDDRLHCFLEYFDILAVVLLVFVLLVVVVRFAAIVYAFEIHLVAGDDDDDVGCNADCYDAVDADVARVMLVNNRLNQKISIWLHSRLLSLRQCYDL